MNGLFVGCIRPLQQYSQFLCVCQELFARIGHSNEDEITFTEFVQYVIEHEKRLELIFRDLDENQDGNFSFFCHYICDCFSLLI